ncbi:MAG: efflux RND transporter periplasmic adaptor subunit [Flavobacteriaceae bacterium]|nr:efflux RND transporter periplasmic adaptor subunit [Flavobacteriaceae bacterium]MDG1962747.1 efflux RND transporter periplasmic adaptor subunit [Flavobacteriaceae bacterium]
MTRITYILSFFILFSACAEKEKSIQDLKAEKNLEALRAKRAEVVQQQHAINETLKEVDDAIRLVDNNEKFSLVTAFEVVPQNFDHFLEVQGDVATKQNVVLYPEFPGLLKTLHVGVGASVRQGDLLATIDDNGLGQQLAQLKVQERLAQTTFDRQKRLWAEKIGSEMQFLQAKAQYESQTNLVAQVEAQLAKTQIRAPFSGTIDAVFAEAGTVVSAGMSGVFRLVNLDHMYLQAEVPESYIKEVTKGKKVSIYFPVLGNEYETSVREVSRFINPDNRTFKIEIDLPNADQQIKPNLTGKVKINDYSNPEALLIPQGILSENAQGQQYVYVAKMDEERALTIAERHIVTTGKTQGDNVEILTGISSGDLIIEEGARSVKDQQAVTILSTEGHE